MMRRSEPQVFLFGPNKLHLELMSLFIEERARVSCKVVLDLNEVPCCADKKHLILYDCAKWTDDLAHHYNSDLKKHLADNLIVLTNMPNTIGIEVDALTHGVRGFVYEQDDTETLLKMIPSVFSSELWVSRNIMTKYIQVNNKNISQYNSSSQGLTSREIEILSSISLGRSNDRIAQKLCISPHTVKTHVYHIFKKINVSSRVQAANWSSQHL
jgi:LuxR family transcriptional regulator, positive regulator of biofilm formation